MSALVPARFLILVSHLILTVIVLLGRVSNSCILTIGTFCVSNVYVWSFSSMMLMKYLQLLWDISFLFMHEVQA